jgi:hypothetical protein
VTLVDRLNRLNLQEVRIVPAAKGSDQLLQVDQLERQMHLPLPPSQAEPKRPTTSSVSRQRVVNMTAQVMEVFMGPKSLVGTTVRQAGMLTRRACHSSARGIVAGEWKGFLNCQVTDLHSRSVSIIGQGVGG